MLTSTAIQLFFPYNIFILKLFWNLTLFISICAILSSYTQLHRTFCMKCLATHNNLHEKPLLHRTIFMKYPCYTKLSVWNLPATQNYLYEIFLLHRSFSMKCNYYTELSVWNIPAKQNCQCEISLLHRTIFMKYSCYTDLSVWNVTYYYIELSVWNVSVTQNYLCEISLLYGTICMKYPCYTDLTVCVRYHCGGWSEEVNSCILNSYMVYL